MNSKLKVVLIAGIALLVFGAAVGTAGFVMGGMKDVVIWPDGTQMISIRDGLEIEEVDQSFENVSSIVIDVDNIDKVVVKEGETLTVKGRNALSIGGLKAERTDSGALTVTHSVRGSGLPWVINLASLMEARSAPASYLEITAPPNVTLSAVSIDVDFGHVELSDVPAGEVLIKSDSGDVKASGLSCGAFEIQSDYGGIDVREVNAANVTIKANSGVTKLRDVLATGALSVESDYGEVDFDTVSCARSEISISSGNFTGRAVTASDGISLRGDYGDIDLSGSLQGDSLIESNAGNVDVTLAGTEDDYSIVAEADAGNVVIGDRKFGGNGRFERLRPAAPGAVEIRCDYGNVRVEFRS
jgi:hypothetical protein